MMFRSFKVFLLILVCFNTAVSAQMLKGAWQGFIMADGLLTRAFILHVKGQNGNIVTGRSYLYDIRYPTLYKPFTFRGAHDFIGTIDQNMCKISELSILDSVMPNDSTFLCKKVLNLKLSKDGDIDLLKGSWNGAIYSKQRCISGILVLKRFELDNPAETELISEVVLGKIREDNLPDISFLNTTLAKPIIIDVSKFTIALEVRDYLQEDFDTVTVYYNRNQIAKKLKLKHRPKKFTIHLDKLSGLSEIIMYADNLGLIPPNTSVITVNDGVRKQNVTISSTKQTSAVIYLRYQPPLTTRQ